MEGHLTLGAPIGNLGVALDLRPSSWFRLNLGMGKTWDDVQGASTARVAFVHLTDSVTLDAGAGLSMGAYTYNSRSWWDFYAYEYDYRAHWNRATWRHFELALERETSSTGWRTYAGRTDLFKRDAPDWFSDWSNGCSAEGHVYYGGFAISMKLGS